VIAGMAVCQVKWKFAEVAVLQGFTLHLVPTDLFNWFWRVFD
jgi:hypothetical protein